MQLTQDQLGAAVIAMKAELRNKGVDYKSAFEGFSASIKQEIDEIKALDEQGASLVPELDFAAVVQGNINDEQKALIHKRGCVVVRNTFSRELIDDWNRRIADYVKKNGYYETPDKGLDKYFSSLQKGKPQILSVYWSKPQMEARQHENLALLRKALNRLWHYERDGQQEFDPDRECLYADRLRQREPGDNSLGLKPHIDGGSVERWLDKQGFHQVYRHLLNGNWQDYDPFDAAYRTKTDEIPSPAVCSMFRTYQGWTALTPQGPNDGTLQLIPSSRVVPWMFLRALQEDVPPDDLCGAQAGRALQCVPQWHSLVLEGLVSIPKMNPGDTIWWHPDLVHAVEDAHRGTGYSNVIYIGAAPYCDKNVAYLKKQAEAFRKGESAPDFAAEHYELAYQDRATESDLTDLGKKQMGLQAW
ncbi:YbiU family protein [Thiolinea disciformis]|uniref:YbiU family protein n=1 Tax=Thiolinea disciformis TaxID=125614 RepID=UPI00035D9F45|nr:YbiU family protein [Thiolinea disciformis]